MLKEKFHKSKTSMNYDMLNANDDGYLKIKVDKNHRPLVEQEKKFET